MRQIGFSCRRIWVRTCLLMSMHQKDLFTFISNKDGHGKKGTLIAVVRGTKASEVVKVLMQIPEDKRIAVKEVTMDYSDSMHAIVEVAFPKADITMDVFHVIKNQCDCLDEMRMRFKRKPSTKLAKEKREFNKKKKLRKKARASYRKETSEEAWWKAWQTKKACQWTIQAKGTVPGDTKVELFTRARYILPKSGRSGATDRKQKRTCSLNWFQNLRRHIL